MGIPNRQKYPVRVVNDTATKKLDKWNVQGFDGTTTKKLDKWDVRGLDGTAGKSGTNSNMWEIYDTATEKGA